MKNTAVHNFRYSEVQQQISAFIILAGVLWLLLMMIYPEIGVTVFPVGVIAFGVIRIIMYNKKFILTVYEDYFEYRTSKFSPGIPIKFTEIENIQNDDKLITINLLETHYPIRLYKSFFRKSDISMVVEILQNFGDSDARSTVKSNENHISNSNDGFLLCNRCDWKGIKNELHSNSSDPTNFVYCPNCSATFSNE